MSYAIITFRDKGPIKNWSTMRGAHIHNSRLKPVRNAVPGAPGPRHLIGTGDLVVDVRDKLARAGINPDRLRKNGVIAFEAVLTASPEFFEEGDKEDREARLGAWVKTQVAFAIERYGRHRIASMVLHLDEKTPHIHLVVLPLEVKRDGRRKDDDLHWSLVGRTISGPGQFDKAQDDYAAAMASFGLVRGERYSGAKNEPPAIFMKRMAEQQRSLDDREAAIATASEDFDRRRRETEDAIAVREARAEAAMAEAQRMMRHANELTEAALRTKMMADADREVARKEKAEARIAIDAERAAAAGEMDKARDLHGRLQKGLATVAGVYGAARDIRERIKALPIERRPSPMVEVVRKATTLEREVAKVKLPRIELDPATIVAFQQMRQAGLGR